MASVGTGVLLSTGELIAEVVDFVVVGEAGGLEDVGARLRKVLLGCFCASILSLLAAKVVMMLKLDKIGNNVARPVVCSRLDRVARSTH